MSLNPIQLVLDFGSFRSGRSEVPAVRRELREEIVRRVEYAPFPRARADQHRRVGFTRDVSPSGLCLGVAHAAGVGSLLRITVRGVDGRATLDSLARVVWQRELGDGEFLVGLELQTELGLGMRLVRRSFIRAQAVA